jgi:hypothetical protein
MVCAEERTLEHSSVLKFEQDSGSGSMEMNCTS